MSSDQSSSPGDLPDGEHEHPPPPGPPATSPTDGPGDLPDDSKDGFFQSDEPAKPNTPGIRVSPEHLEKMQKHVVWGLGGIAVITLLALVVMATIRPELSSLAATLGQVIFSGLLGLGGSVAGYLFLRDSGSGRGR